MPSYLDTQKHLHQCVYAWFATAPGKRLLEMEHQVLDRLSQGLFGYYLAQIQGGGHTLDWLVDSPIQRKLLLAVNRDDVVAPSIQACSETLPLATASVDAVILPHTLDFALDPHRVLREVERVLIPGGHVIILGFNPVSIWGLGHLLLRNSDQTPWSGHFIPYRRVVDWLSVLGFDIELSDVCAFAPPVAHQRWVESLHWMETLGRRFMPSFAGVYALRAVKRVSTARPIKMRMQRLRTFKPSVAVVGKISSNHREPGTHLTNTR